MQQTCAMIGMIFDQNIETAYDSLVALEALKKLPQYQ